MSVGFILDLARSQLSLAHGAEDDALPKRKLWETVLEARTINEPHRHPA